MPAVVNRVKWTADRSGALAPGLDQGAVGNQTNLYATPYLAGRYSVPAAKKVSIKTLGYLCNKPASIIPHTVGYADVGACAVLLNASEYLWVARFFGQGLPNGSGAEDMGNTWRCENQLPHALNGITITTTDTLNVIVSPSVATEIMWNINIFGRLAGAPAVASARAITVNTTGNQNLFAYTPPSNFTLLNITVTPVVVGAVAGLMQSHHDGSLNVDFGRVGMESSACQSMDCQNANGAGKGGIFLPLWNMDFYPDDDFSLGVESWANDTITDFQQVVFGMDADITVGAPDLPAVGDVRNTVVFDNGTKTGTLVVPTEPQVENGVGFGTDGTEFTGSLVGGSGGGSLFIRRR